MTLTCATLWTKGDRIMKKFALQCPPSSSNKYLIFNAFFVLTVLLTSISAFAFGGGGRGRVHERYKVGVDAIGIHRDANKDEQADIKFNCDDPNASPNMQGVCECNEGYIANSEGTCVPNQCLDFSPTECITDCDPVTSEKTYSDGLCHNDEYYCNNNHECVNPCDEAEYDTECQTCTPNGNQADLQNKTGTCGADNHYICQSGICTNPCTIGEHPTNACIPSYHAENGECVADYLDPGATCGTNMTSDANHDCVCPDGYFWNGTSCFAPCTKANNFHRLSGTCLACDANTRVETTEAECTTCGNQRKVITDDTKTYCATINCGSGNFQDAKGTCHGCTINTAYPVESVEACTTACPTRHIETKTDGTLSCVKGCAEGFEEVEGKCVEKCSEGQERDAQGVCQPTEYCPPCDNVICPTNTTCHCGRCECEEADTTYGQRFCINITAGDCTSNTDCTDENSYCDISYDGIISNTYTGTCTPSSTAPHAEGAYNYCKAKGGRWHLATRAELAQLENCSAILYDNCAGEVLTCDGYNCGCSQTLKCTDIDGWIDEARSSTTGMAVISERDGILAMWSTINNLRNAICLQ